MLLEFFCIVIAGAFILYWWLRNRTNGLPNRVRSPSTAHWLVGDVKLMLDLEKAAKACADSGIACTMRMLHKYTLVVNDYETIKKLALEKGDAISARAQDVASRTFSFNNHGVIFNDGELWQEQRRFTLTTMRTLGFGKSSMEHLILEEIDDLVEDIKRAKCFDPYERLAHATASIVASFLYGTRRYSADADFKALVKQLSKSEAIASASFAACMLCPVLAYIPFSPTRNAWLDVWRDVEVLFCSIRAQVEKHNSLHKNAVDNNNLDENNKTESTGLIDAFMAKRKQNIQQFGNEGNYTDIQAFVLIKDMFLAGMDTTSTTVAWAMQFMVNFPDVQQRVADEIKAQLGDAVAVSPITSADRIRLPYTDAVLHEIMRYRTIGPFALPHSTTCQVELNGYTLQKGQQVWLNLWAVHHDEKLWKKADEFYPENFLAQADDSSDANQVAVNNDDEAEVQLKPIAHNCKLIVPKYFMPFSIGKRACLGESLARMETFLIFANLMRVFEVSAPTKAGDKFPSARDARSDQGLILKPITADIQFGERVYS